MTKTDAAWVVGFFEGYGFRMNGSKRDQFLIRTTNPARFVYFQKFAIGPGKG